MGYIKQVKTVKISDPLAVELINQKAAAETRTAANAATIVIREALGGDSSEPNRPGRPRKGKV